MSAAMALLDLVALGVMIVLWWESVTLDYKLKRWIWFGFGLFPPIGIARGAMIRLGLA